MTRDEFEEILLKYENDLYKLSLRLCNSKEDSEDLFQNTWLYAIEHLDKIETTNNPESYLYGRMYYIWKSDKRKMMRRQSIAAVDSYDEIEIPDRYSGEEVLHRIINSDEKRALLAEISKLKDKHRIVIELFYGLEKTTTEISIILNIPKGTVESRLHKARMILKQKMEVMGYGL